MSKAPPTPDEASANEAAQLRLSSELQWVPIPRAPPAPSPAVQAPPDQGRLGASMVIRQASSNIMKAATHANLLPVTLGLGGIALAASVGWLILRRRHAHVQAWGHKPGSVPTAGQSPHPTPTPPPVANASPPEQALSVNASAINETQSRREATLIDLHQLHMKLRGRCTRNDLIAAALLLQQHLVDFRYSSPWVFLELFELYKLLGKRAEWEIAREAFRKRFGQNAPEWSARTTADVGLDADPHLAEQLAKLWPHRVARMWALRWMLGETNLRQQAQGPALLPLGVYRDMMVLDELLDEVMVSPRKASETIERRQR